MILFFESWFATRRLRRFRMREILKVRDDAMQFSLSESVIMASLKREAFAIAGIRKIKSMNIESGHILTVEAEGMTFKLEGSRVSAFRS